MITGDRVLPVVRSLPQDLSLLRNFQRIILLAMLRSICFVPSIYWSIIQLVLFIYILRYLDGNDLSSLGSNAFHGNSMLKVL